MQILLQLVIMSGDTGSTDTCLSSRASIGAIEVSGESGRRDARFGGPRGVCRCVTGDDGTREEAEDHVLVMTVQSARSKSCQ